MSILKQTRQPAPVHRPARLESGCGQACIDMIISTFENVALPDAELSSICGVKKPGAFSSVFDIASGMAARGYETIRMADITPEDNFKDPYKYLKAVGFDPGPDSPIIEARRASIQKFMECVKQGKIQSIDKSPATNDIADLIRDHYGLISWVNSATLKGDFTRTVGHYIVPIDVDQDYIVYHDPGGITENYGPVYSVGASAHRDLFHQATRYPEAIGLNPETGQQRTMGLLAFRPTVL